MKENYKETKTDIHITRKLCVCGEREREREIEREREGDNERERERERETKIDRLTERREKER